MLPREYETQNCSVARTLELIGDRWTILIVRDAFLGVRRFDDFQRSLGIARNVLAGRLQRLTDDGVLERRRYQERPVRCEYALTRRGLDLWPVIVSLKRWGDTHLAPDGKPLLFEHRDCGGEIDLDPRCGRCGEEVGVGGVVARPGPGAVLPPTSAAA